MDRAKEVFRDHFRISNGERYLGGFVGTKTEENAWLTKKVDAWFEGFKLLLVVATQFPQTAYAVLQKSLQAEWKFVQSVTNLGPNAPVFTRIEEALATRFLLHLLGVLKIEASLWRIFALPVKALGLALPDPTVTGAENHTVLTVCMGEIIAAMRKKAPFNHKDHMVAMRETKAELWKQHLEREGNELESLLRKLPQYDRCTIERGKATGAWLTCLPSTLAGTELSWNKFMDSLCLCYCLPILDLPELCDRCGKKCNVQHALNCMKGGLIIA